MYIHMYEIAAVNTAWHVATQSNDGTGVIAYDVYSHVHEVVAVDTGRRTEV